MNNEFIIVDDDVIKENSYVYDTEQFTIRHLKHKHNETDFDVNILASTHLPTLFIDFNGFEKDFEFHKSYDMAYKHCKKVKSNSGYYDFIDGFNAAMKINEKKFTLDDMLKAFNYSESLETSDNFDSFIDSISKPKMWNIDIEINTHESIKIVKHEIHNDSNLLDTNDDNLEQFLINNGFEIDTYYGTNKRYVKTITDYQNLYVRIYSDVNEIVDVEYEHLALSEYDKYSIVSLETINTIEQLKMLLKTL
jgi:hypothetical protein